MTKLQAGKRTTIISGIVNTLLAATKTVLGSISGSTALLADGIHSLADLLSDIFAYGMIKISHEEADNEHPYGHGKFETIGTLCLALMLAITSVWISYEAIHKYIQGEHTLTLGWVGLIATFISVIANEGLYHYCKRVGERVGSSIIIANAWHHRTDSLSSIAAFVGIGLAMLGYHIADSIAALVVTVMLLKMSYTIGKEAFDELVDTAVDEETQQHIVNVVSNISGVIGCHELRTRMLGGKVFVDVHVDVPSTISVSEGHALAESVEHALLAQVPSIQDVVTHIDPVDVDQRPIPQNLLRPHIENTISAILKKTLGEGTTLKKLTFHLLKSGYIAEITLQAKTRPTQAGLSATKQAITRETPFVDATFTLALEEV